MGKYSYSAGEPVEVAVENEAAFEAAGWSPVEDETPAEDEKAPKKADK
jgi:hypothetical protein